MFLCTFLLILLEKVYTQTETTLSLSTTHPCEDVILHIKNVTIESNLTELKLIINWELEPNVETCKPTFNIYAHALPAYKQVPYFRRTNDSLHLIKNLKSCTFYNVTVFSGINFNTKGLQFNRIVSTLPQKVTDLSVTTLTDSKNETIIKWTNPFLRECITHYKVQWDQFVQETTQTSLKTNPQVYCKRVTITPVCASGLGEPTSIQAPGEVESFAVSSTNNTIHLKWMRPINGFCITGYHLFINNKLIEINNQTSYNITNLNYCTSYGIHMQSVNKFDKSGLVYVYHKTGKPTFISPVRNFTTRIMDRRLFFTWDMNSLTHKCNKKFNLRIVINNKLNYTKDVFSNFLLIGTEYVPACLNSTVFIRESIEHIYGQVQSHNFYFNIAPDSPRLIETIEKDNHVVFRWQLDQHSICQVHSLIVKCLSEMDYEQTVYVKGADLIGEYVTAIIDHLQPLRNYVCGGRVSTSAGRSMESQPVFIRLKKKVKNDKNLLVVGENQAHFQWYPPDDIINEIIGYNLSIVRTSPAYYLPDFCPKDDFEELIPLFANVTAYDIKVQVGFNYTITLYWIVNSNDLIIEPTRYVISKPKSHDRPQTPLNLSANVDFTINATTYNASVLITWNYPCEMNGVLKSFDLKLERYYRHNNSMGNFTYHELFTNQIQNNYTLVLNHLRPYSKYIVRLNTVTINRLRSEVALTSFITPEFGKFNHSICLVPEAPTVKIDRFSDNIRIEWKPPNEPNGIIIAYKLQLIGGLMYQQPKYCQSSSFVKQIDINPPAHAYQLNFKAYFNYTVEIRAQTRNGLGNVNVIEYISQERPSDELENLSILPYLDVEEPKVDVMFKLPCDLNGKFENITITGRGIRSGFQLDKLPIKLVDKISEEFSLNYLVKAEYNYVFHLHLHTKSFLTISTIAFEAPTALPKLQGKTPTDLPIQLQAKTVELTLFRNLFSEDNGRILYYAIIVGEKQWNEDSTFGVWNYTRINTWPLITSNLNNSKHLGAYQATPSFWNPFLTNESEFKFIIGDGECVDQFCNLILKPETEYTFKVRGFTKHWYKDTPLIPFTLEKEIDYNWGLIVAGVFCVIPAIVTIIVIAVITKGRKVPSGSVKESVKEISMQPMVRDVTNFPEYYQMLLANEELIKEEFSLLGRKSENSMTISAALVSNNKNKNRYSNILPYDETRVKLSCDEETDYINASHIKGFSNNKEYIATQGPLKHTCRDFWEMVWQQQVNLIVMLTQIVEQNTEKCFKYFPVEEGETVNEEIEVYCKSNVKFPSYHIRNLIVRKKEDERTISHLQFVKWPDFGCPEDTNCLLEFLEIIREYRRERIGKSLFHCSAGVGRTGTLLALDLVLDQIEQNKPINVFGTVLYLRMQRKNMVQTEKQYLYIHSCVNSAISKIQGHLKKK